MRHLRNIVLILITLLAFTTIVHAQTNTPEQIASDYVTALFSPDEPTTTALLCEDDQELFSAQEPSPIVEYLGGSILTADLSDLDYEIVHEGEDWARVHVSGEITVTVEGKISAKTLSPNQVKLGHIWTVREADEWKVCLRPPTAALLELEPNAIAQVFFEAAYGLDYEIAHSLICEKNIDTFSQPEFERVFGVLESQKLRVDLSEVTYEISEQTEKTATVQVGGIMNLTEAQRPSPFRIPAAQMGLGPVQLVLENGWKVCSSVES